jgi:hypothetical protein
VSEDCPIKDNVGAEKLNPSRANGMTSEERPVDELLIRNPELRRHLADHGGTWMLLRGGVLNIYGELDSTDAERIGGQAKLELIPFGRKFDVPDATLRLLNDYVLAQHPQASLRETLNGFEGQFPT